MNFFDNARALVAIFSFGALLHIGWFMGGELIRYGKMFLHRHD